MSRRRSHRRPGTAEVNQEKIQAWKELSGDMTLILNSMPLQGSSFEEKLLMELLFRINRNINQLNPGYVPVDIPF